MWHINSSVDQVQGLGGFPNLYEIELFNVFGPLGTLNYVEVMTTWSMAIVHH